MVAPLASVAGAALCAGVAIHEFQYRLENPFRSGPAVPIAILAVGAALRCLAVPSLAWDGLRRGR